MSLFIGNVSKKVTMTQLQQAFKSFGNCKIDLRKRYCFVQYDSQRCAEDAKQSLQNINFSGLRLNIEWSKNSGRFNQNNKMRNDRMRKRRSNSPDRNWRKEERHFRRSPSYERRLTPTYSENEDFDTFESKCPRDRELSRRLKAKRDEGREGREREVKELKVKEKQMKEEKQEKEVKMVEEGEARMDLQAGEAI